MSRTYYIPTVLLRCSKCHNQTPHLLIDFQNQPKFGITLTYECQMCGETKKAFDLNTLPEFNPEISQSATSTASTPSTPAKEESKAPLESKAPPVIGSA